MSVVATKVYKDRIEICADSIVVSGHSKNTKGDFTKIHKDNGMIIGTVGSAEEGSLMWHYMSTHKPANSTEKDILSFIIEFANWKRDLTGNSSICNSYILAYDGKVFMIENMLVYEISSYEAIGAGQDFANAVLYLGHSAKEAVKVACELSCYVSEPIIEYEMKRN